MSQQKDEMAGLAIVLAGIVVAIYYVMIAVAAMLALSAIVFTFLALIAWNNPLYLGSETLKPEEARAFIYRGLFGAAAAPILTFLVWLFLDRHAFDWEIYALSAGVGYVLGSGVGYVLGSVGIEILAAMDEAERISTRPVASPSKPPALSPAQSKALPAPPQNVLPAPPKKPFRYASWNDEELRQ